MVSKCGISPDRMGAPKCGVTIRWKPMALEVKEFTRGKTKEIVYPIHFKGAAGTTAEQRQ